MKKRNRYFLLCIALLTFVTFPLVIYFTFPDTSKLIISLFTQTLPDPSHLSRLRNDLLEQESFINMLIQHEKETLNRFKKKRGKIIGEKIYSQNTNFHV